MGKLNHKLPKLAAKARSLGWQMSDKELEIIVNQVRKLLSTSFIRAQSLCLISRMSYLGEGAQAAAGTQVYILHGDPVFFPSL